MNKSTVSKLEKLHQLFKRHEEEIEGRFSAKQTAIFRYRIGAEDNSLHELTDVAGHFKCSVSYVTKVIRDITVFAKGLEKKTPKRAEKKTAQKETAKSAESGVRIAIMSAKIEGGKVTVKHADPEVAAKVQSHLQEMLDNAKPCGECESCVSNKAKIGIAEEARLLNAKAGSRGAWAFIALISALLLGLVVTVKTGDLTGMQVVAGYGLVAVIAFAGLMSYISGVSYMGKRNGLLEGLRRL